VQSAQPAPAVPAGHAWQTALPAADSVPSAHGGQDVALVFSAKVFAAHCWQAGCASWWLKRPGMHGRQADLPDAGWYCPGGQRLHAGRASSSVNFPLAHGVQSALSLKVPGGQSPHEDWPGAVVPLPWGQASHFSCATLGAMKFCEHSVHVGRPVRLLKRPGMQG